MRTHFGALIAALAVWGSVASNTASAQLSRADQLFLYFNYYQTQRTTLELQRQQNRQQTSLNQLSNQHQELARDVRFPRNIVGRYQPRNRTSPQLTQQELPSIYDSRGRSRFLQYNQYFSPAR